jgi:hypothetical protein
MYRQRSESFQHLSFAHMGRCTASELQVPLAFEHRTHDEMYGQRGEGWRQVSFAHTGQCTARRGTVPSAFERREHDEMYGPRSAWAAGIRASRTRAIARPVSYRCRSRLSAVRTTECTARELGVAAGELRTRGPMYGQRVPARAARV